MQATATCSLRRELATKEAVDEAQAAAVKIDQTPTKEDAEARGQGDARESATD